MANHLQKSDPSIQFLKLTQVTNNSSKAFEMFLHSKPVGKQME